MSRGFSYPWGEPDDSGEDEERFRDGERETRCNHCGSTDVRWRQQGGKWVLFSLQPGVVHACPIVDGFGVVE